MNKITEAKSIICPVSEKSNRAILFFSCGKDSLALLDLMRPYFEEIVCVFMYFVKDLEHINKYLRWAKAKYNITIEQVPHWNLTYILRNGIFCPPKPKIKLLTLKDIDNAVRIKYGINYSFFGMKKADGMNRRLMLNTYENGISSTNKVYPLQDWANKDVINYCTTKRIPNPIRYSKNASGGCGFNIECFLYLRENYPNDLHKILQSFPLSEKILIDHDKNKSE